MPSFKQNTMVNKRAYEIPFVGLKPGVHPFSYELNEEFFSEKGAEDFANAHANVKLSLEKSSGFMLLKFEVGGKADVSCDRCGNPLNMDLWDEFKLVVKLVDNAEEMNNNEEDPDVFYLSKTESHLEVSDWLYEFVMLSVPTQRMCSLEERGGAKCNNEILEKLRQMEVKEVEHNANTLWKGLDKFKEN